MDGVHDLGGAHGFGPVVVEANEPPFHEPWEGRVHGLMLTASASGVASFSRLSIEQMDPVHYLASSYYEHWLAGVETNLVENGTLGAGELDAAVAAGKTPGRREQPDAAQFMRSLFRPFSPGGADGPSPRYAAGERVRVRRMHPTGHTRCPRYVRGAMGTIARVHPPSPLPDTESDHQRECSYSVSFAARELWGAHAEPNASVVVDLWESYLEDPE